MKVDITALKIKPTVPLSELIHVRKVRNFFLLLNAPSLHGGRGATPAEGGHPSDLTYLAGGGHVSRRPHLSFTLSSGLLKGYIRDGRGNANDKEDSYLRLYLSGCG